MKKKQNDSVAVDNKTNPRRTFLKKTVYIAPVLIVLGQLAKPTNAHADGSSPDGPPSGWGGF